MLPIRNKPPVYIASIPWYRSQTRANQNGFDRKDMHCCVLAYQPVYLAKVRDRVGGEQYLLEATLKSRTAECSGAGSASSAALSWRNSHTDLFVVTSANEADVIKERKEVDLYSAFIVVPHTQGAQVRITPANCTVPASTS